MLHFNTLFQHFVSTFCCNLKFALAFYWSIALISNSNIAVAIVVLVVCLLAFMLTMQFNLVDINSVAWLDCADRND